MFDVELFVKATPEGRINYLNTCNEKEITIEDSKYYNNVMFPSNTDLMLAMAEKRFICNGFSVLTRIVNHFTSTIETIKKALEIYEKNGWFDRPSERTIIHDIFSYPEILEYTIDLYDRLGIPINVTGGWRSKEEDTLGCALRYGRLEIINRLLEEYNKREYPIPEDVFVEYVRNGHYTRKFDPKPFKEFYDLTTSAGCSVVDPSGEVINRISRYFMNWKFIKEKIIDPSLEAGIDINIGNNLLVNIGRNFGKDALGFILDYAEKHGQDINERCSNPYTAMRFTDNVIAYNTKEALLYLLERGIKFENYANRRYVPCHDCYNGESHSCNYRWITSNFMALERYQLTLDELELVKNIKEQPRPYHDRYSSFEGPADEDQIFDVPGIGLLNPDADYEDFSVYKVPMRLIAKEDVKI